MYMYVYKKKNTVLVLSVLYMYIVCIYMYTTLYMRVCMYRIAKKKKKKMSTALLDERFILRIKSGQKFVMQGYIGVFGKI